MNAPEYLLKFVPKRKYAEDLVAGTLFTRPAGYYISLELGRGDWRESTIASGMALYKNFNMPIYCMVAVEHEEIKNGVYRIDERIICDFQCKNGSVAIVKYLELIKRLPKFENGQMVAHGYVDYREINFTETPYLLVDSKGVNLRIKNPDLYYQHEYRFIFPEHLYQPNEKRVEFKYYKLTDTLDKCSDIRDISSLRIDESSFLLPINI